MGAAIPAGKLSGPAQKTGRKLASSGALGPEGKAAAKLTPDMSADEVNAELQRRRKAAATRSAARRSAQTSGPPAPSTPPAPAGPGTSPAVPAPTSSGAGLPVPAPVQAAASTGSGLLLGIFAWAAGLAYLRGGSAGVKQLLRAKFFNQT